MESKFKVGDRVMCTDDGALGVITSIDIDPIGVCDGYTVLFDDGEETWVCADMVELSDEPLYDPKTAFLLDLAGVLRKHNAVINVVLNDYADPTEAPRIDMDICFVDSKRGIFIEDVLDKTITADNIMDYDKE